MPKGKIIIAYIMSIFALVLFVFSGYCEEINNSAQVADLTPEKALQKVADNYAKISDLKADETLFSTLNGEPYGDKLYCRYYFKAPTQESSTVREKTDTFSDEARNTKTESDIIVGSKFYMIDVENKNIEEQDLLSMSGLKSGQFDQMDMQYHLSIFLDKHILTKDEANTDPGNQIIAINAIPKEPNDLYPKMDICVDYNKGILVKLVFYNKNADGQPELAQTLEVLETKQMPNGAWIPIKMNKTPNISSGHLVTTLEYTDPQINTGLSDEVFDATKQY